MEFSADEEPIVVGSVLAHAAFFNKEAALKDYNDYKAGEIDKDEVGFYLDAVENIVSESSNSIAINTEEWYGGFATDKSTAQQMYIEAESSVEEAEGDWD